MRPPRLPNPGGYSRVNAYLQLLVPLAPHFTRATRTSAAIHELARQDRVPRQTMQRLHEDLGHRSHLLRYLLQECAPTGYRCVVPGANLSTQNLVGLLTRTPDGHSEAVVARGAQWWHCDDDYVRPTVLWIHDPVLALYYAYPNRRQYHADGGGGM